MSRRHAMLALLSEGVLVAVRMPGTDPHEVIQAHRRYLVVTHDAQLAPWADRVVFLRDGRVTGQAAPAPGPESPLAPRETR
jgi:hypothetical protein